MHGGAFLPKTIVGLMPQYIRASVCPAFQVEELVTTVGYRRGVMGDFATPMGISFADMWILLVRRGGGARVRFWSRNPRKKPSVTYLAYTEYSRNSSN